MGFFHAKNCYRFQNVVEFMFYFMYNNNMYVGGKKDMTKVMAVNAGSSSLKFQLFNMPSEEVITSGIVERIGMDDGIFTIKYNGEKKTTTCPIPDHQVAVDMLLKALVEEGVVKELSEINAVGHRIVHGG